METPQSRPTKVLKWSLIIGIVIVLNLFYNYSLSLVFSAPEYNNFCIQKQVTVAPETQEACIAQGGAWTSYPESVQNGQETSPKAKGYCDVYYECQKKYTDARTAYEKNVFVSLVVVGVLTFIAGIFLASNEVLSISLSLGAVLNFVVASVRYWGEANDLVKVFILAIALGILMWIASKKFNSSSEKHETQ